MICVPAISKISVHKIESNDDHGDIKMKFQSQ